MRRKKRNVQSETSLFSNGEKDLIAYAKVYSKTQLDLFLKDDNEALLYKYTDGIATFLLALEQLVRKGNSLESTVLAVMNAKKATDTLVESLFEVFPDKVKQKYTLSFIGTVYKDFDDYYRNSLVRGSHFCVAVAKGTVMRFVYIIRKCTEIDPVFLSANTLKGVLLSELPLASLPSVVFYEEAYNLASETLDELEQSISQGLNNSTPILNKKVQAMYESVFNLIVSSSDKNLNAHSLYWEEYVQFLVRCSVDNAFFCTNEYVYSLTLFFYMLYELQSKYKYPIRLEFSDLYQDSIELSSNLVTPSAPPVL